MGFGVSAPDVASDGEEHVRWPWRKVGGKMEIDFLFRDPAAACGSGAAVVPDRLLVVVDGNSTVSLPLTLTDAVRENFVDVDCWPYRGQHMLYPKAGLSTSSLMLIYGGDGRVRGVHMRSTQYGYIPPFEPRESEYGLGPAYGLVVYFDNHDDPTCPDFPTMAPPAPEMV